MPSSKVKEFLPLFAIILIAIAGYVLYDSGLLYKAILPEKYWGKQVSNLEFGLKNNEEMIRSFKHDIIINKLISELDINDRVESELYFNDLVETETLLELQFEIAYERAIKDQGIEYMQ